ncbi:cation diffusion facilitator family transporter [Carboxylicivirga sp. M1479]|uniref:cation diffusion facilitator family transporter n=1 Tax=Carboxylicivirga sp. M1479 TaxID=2594476 RepID=UPI0011781333|nr:cation diffusion facilitator family transporter [Carboxylicivirga sp. M1479]TRX71649.1 cation transporter [Carboxylicivirga sp. M1479]
MENKKGILATYGSIVLNIFLFAIKLWAGIVSSSVAIIADAWHTLSDSISSVAVLIGLKVSAKPADDEHPYGHGRAEVIASIVVSMLLAIIGFSFLKESIIKLQSKSDVQYGTIAIVVTVISFLVKEFMAQYSIRIGKKTNSKSMIADGWHHRSDAISSLVILVGIFIGNHFWWMDGVLGILVSILLFYTTYSILKENISHLLGEGIEDELKDEIILLADEVAEFNIHPHHFLVHQYGNHTEMTFHIRLPSTYTIHNAHEIATAYEILIKKRTNIQATVHIDSLDL